MSNAKVCDAIEAHCNNNSNSKDFALQKFSVRPESDWIDRSCIRRLLSGEIRRPFVMRCFLRAGMWGEIVVLYNSTLSQMMVVSLGTAQIRTKQSTPCVNEQQKQEKEVREGRAGSKRQKSQVASPINPH